MALTDLHVWNVIRHGQQVGVYSRFGWNHPGPLYLYLLVPLHVLTDFRHLSAVFTAATLNVAVLMAVVAVMAREARAPLAVTCLAFMALYLSETWGLLASAWNPHVAILALALLLVCAAGTVVNVWYLPAAIACACFVAQTHVSFMPSAFGVAASATLYSLAQFIRLRRLPARRALLTTFLVAVVLWAPPLIDAAGRNGTRNLQNIAATFDPKAPEDRSTRRARDHAFTRYVTAPVTGDLSATWRSADARPTEAPTSTLIAEAQAALLLIASVGWFLRGRRFEAALGFYTLVGSVVAWLAIRRIPEVPTGHTVYWVSILGVVSWTVTTAFLVDLVFNRRGSRWAPGATSYRRTLLAFVALAGVSCAALQIRGQYPRLLESGDRVDRVTTLVAAALEKAGSRTPLIGPNQDYWHYSAGLVLQLTLAGWQPRVSDDWLTMFGRWYASSGDETIAISLVNSDDHEQEYSRRSDVSYLGEVSGTFVYTMVVAPAIPVTPQLVAGGGPFGTLTDGTITPSVELIPTASATFFGSDALVVIRLSAGTAGIRLFGQPDSIWQFHCRLGQASGYLGRMRLPGSASAVARGETWLNQLSACTDLQLSSAVPAPQWLTEVQGLQRASPRTP